MAYILVLLSITDAVDAWLWQFLNMYFLQPLYALARLVGPWFMQFVIICYCVFILLHFLCTMWYTTHVYKLPMSQRGLNYRAKITSLVGEENGVYGWIAARERERRKKEVDRNYELIEHCMAGDIAATTTTMHELAKLTGWTVAQVLGIGHELYDDRRVDKRVYGFPEDRITAISVAAMYGHIRLVAMLLCHGASLSAMEYVPGVAIPGAEKLTDEMTVLLGTTQDFYGDILIGSDRTYLGGTVWQRFEPQIYTMRYELVCKGLRVWMRKIHAKIHAIMESEDADVSYYGQLPPELRLCITRALARSECIEAIYAQKSKKPIGSNNLILNPYPHRHHSRWDQLHPDLIRGASVLKYIHGWSHTGKILAFVRRVEVDFASAEMIARWHTVAIL